MNKMTSRERVLAAARHEPVDRLPVMLWVEPHAMLKMSQGAVRPSNPAVRFLFDGIENVKNALPEGQARGATPFLTYLCAVDYLSQLGTDIVEFSWFDPLTYIKAVRLDNGKIVAKDVYGVERSMMGLYLEVSKVPCATPEELDRYKFPHLSNRGLYEGIKLFKKTHPGLAVAVDVPGIQDVSQWFMGMENLYMWMALYPDVIKRFFEKFLLHTIELTKGIMQAGADIITILDDYGAQKRMLISKRMWEEFSFPCLKRQCEEVHRRGGVVMLHSCGYVQPLLGGIVDAGVDIIQSFQPAAGNDFRTAKAEFGDRICFATGIDSQTLGGKTPAEVRESILESVSIGAPGGGYILSTNHALQVDAPDENIKALFDTLEEIKANRY